MTKLWHLNFIQGKFCLNNPHFQVEAKTVGEQDSRCSQRHFDRATRLRLIDLYSCLLRLAGMFYFSFIFKPIDKLFLAVLLCEQLKLQAFQTIKKLKREPSDNNLVHQRLAFRQHFVRPKTDQTWFAEQITIHGSYLSKKKTYFYSCYSQLANGHDTTGKACVACRW